MSKAFITVTPSEAIAYMMTADMSPAYLQAHFNGDRMKATEWILNRQAKGSPDSERAETIRSLRPEIARQMGSR